MSLKMVQGIYNQNSPIPTDEFFYLHSLKEIEEDGISSQVYSLLKQQGRLRDTPLFFQKRLKEKYEIGLYQNMFIKNQTQMILNTLEKKRIDVIPLKGVFFAESYFNDIGGRVTTDIDLLIRHQDLENVIEIVKSLGFTNEEPKITGHFHLSLSKHLPGSDVPLAIELHWNLVREDTSSFQVQDFWEEANPMGNYKYVKLLSPSHTFYMICLHGWRHNLDSMRYFIDILQVLIKSSEEIDFNQVMKLASNHQTIKRVSRTLSIVSNQFPNLLEEYSIPFERKKTFWEYRAVRGIRLYMDFFDYQFLSFDTITHSLREFVHWIWPSRMELHSKFKKIKGD